MSVRGLAVLAALALWAQAPATRGATEIYLAPFVEGPPKYTRIAFLTIGRSGIKVGKPVNITKHAAHDDRPVFLTDSTGLLFASSRDGGEAGVYRYDLATKALTPEREKRAAELTPTDAEGRRLIARPQAGTMTFIDQRVDGTAMIREIDPATNKPRALAAALEGSDNLVWTPGGLALMANGSKIFRLGREDDSWYTIADLKGDGVKAITQLAVSPDGKWIAIVSDPAVK